MWFNEQSQQWSSIGDIQSIYQQISDLIVQQQLTNSGSLTKVRISIVQLLAQIKIKDCKPFTENFRIDHVFESLQELFLNKKQDDDVPGGSNKIWELMLFFLVFSNIIDIRQLNHNSNTLQSLQRIMNSLEQQFKNYILVFMRVLKDDPNQPELLPLLCQSVSGLMLQNPQLFANSVGALQDAISLNFSNSMHDKGTSQLCNLFALTITCHQESKKQTHSQLFSSNLNQLFDLLQFNSGIVTTSLTNTQLQEQMKNNGLYPEFVESLLSDTQPQTKSKNSRIYPLQHLVKTLYSQIFTNKTDKKTNLSDLARVNLVIEHLIQSMLGWARKEGVVELNLQAMVEILIKLITFDLDLLQYIVISPLKQQLQLQAEKKYVNGQLNQLFLERKLQITGEQYLEHSLSQKKIALHLFQSLIQSKVLPINMFADMIHGGLVKLQQSTLSDMCFEPIWRFIVCTDQYGLIFSKLKSQLMLDVIEKLDETLTGLLLGYQSVKKHKRLSLTQPIVKKTQPDKKAQKVISLGLKEVSNKIAPNLVKQRSQVLQLCKGLYHLIRVSQGELVASQVFSRLRALIYKSLLLQPVIIAKGLQARCLKHFVRLIHMFVSQERIGDDTSNIVQLIEHFSTNTISLTHHLPTRSMLMQIIARISIMGQLPVINNLQSSMFLLQTSIHDLHANYIQQYQQNPPEALDQFEPSIDKKIRSVKSIYSEQPLPVRETKSQLHQQSSNEIYYSVVSNEQPSAQKLAPAPEPIDSDLDEEIPKAEL